MDDKPATGSAKPVERPGSEQSNGARKPIGATLGSTGTIDPALARKTAGGDRPQRPTGTPNPDTTGNATVIGTEQPAPRRGRGRPPGPSNTEKGHAAKADATPRGVNIDGVEKILFSIHTVMAAMSGVPELNLDEQEAKDVAKAVQAVGEHYKIILDPKTAAWLELGRVCGVVYGPRAVSIWVRMQMQAKTVPPTQKPKAAFSPAPLPPDPPPGNDITHVFDPTKIRMN